MNKKKEVIILSGFLGTGKTTVLQNLIKASSDKKIAILLNDFGDVPVDGTLISQGGAIDSISAPIVEIGGGSVFCSCLKEAFVKAMFSLATSDAERILVEASGMSDPSGVMRMLELANLDTFYEEALVICLFDPQRSLKLSNVLEVIPRQIKAAHLVFLTKSDITSEEERQKSREYIKSVNADIPIFDSYNGVIDLDSIPKENLYTPKMQMGALGSIINFNTPETRPDSFVIRESINNLDAFIATLSQYPALLRVKGYANSDKGIVYITDGEAGISATNVAKLELPLTVICMQNESKVLQEALQTYLQ